MTRKLSAAPHSSCYARPGLRDWRPPRLSIPPERHPSFVGVKGCDGGEARVACERAPDRRRAPSDGGASMNIRRGRTTRRPITEVCNRRKPGTTHRVCHARPVG